MGVIASISIIIPIAGHSSSREGLKESKANQYRVKCLVRDFKESNPFFSVTQKLKELAAKALKTVINEKPVRELSLEARIAKFQEFKKAEARRRKFAEIIENFANRLKKILSHSKAQEEAIKKGSGKGIM